ncbi:MAG: cyclic nucleotide-binding domain-containing protein [Gammaproteobacteria bacterium]|nr:MAG: cyclic nucleotide-binding domain-containing protein [Gammaproteobacteria bacterium]UCH41409.1 MAG: cyclic nucleotide-binding domain-containing protein [Gammaproteobacteria bacterium]
MAEPQILTPAPGSRIVMDEAEVVLFGQPPEVLKGLLREGVSRFDTLVLTDIREKNNALLNNLEFPLYFFLFFSKGLAEKRKINLVGDAESISHAMRLLRFTLIGPSRDELERWHTEEGLKNEWLAVSEALALKQDNGDIIQVDEFFNAIPFDNNLAVAGDFAIERKGVDRYLVTSHGGDVYVDLNDGAEVTPPYPVPTDYVPGGLTKMSIEVLGGASGFSTSEPCTGLALCYNGDYLLIDSIPFLDQHLFARGISKNQVSAVFLTHLHDDHCSMFPLLDMPHCVEVITTQEIFNMAMEKLACSLGWKVDSVAEHFQLIRVKPGDTINYYGLTIQVHNTVHSIPTIGATFSTIHKGQFRDVCIVGDNQNMTAVREMGKSGIVRAETIENLERLYKQKFHLLIADGGAGEIHGDPTDALGSEAERVVFVHVEQVPEALQTTFSLASSGKRYTLIEGDSMIYTSQINHYLTKWLGQPFPNRWMRNLLAEQEIYRYNTEDVIIVQEAVTHGSVYLILTGYCEVVRVEDGVRETVAMLQAGDVIGEMAILTGSGIRNASVVAKTPVTVCVFAEETFRNFIRYSGLQDMLEKRWLLRPVIKLLPQFAELSSTVTDKISRIAEWKVVEGGKTMWLDDTHLYIFVEGFGSIVHADGTEEKIVNGEELGWRAYTEARTVEMSAASDCGLISIDAGAYRELLKSTPQLNYHTRKRLTIEGDERVGWLLGEVPIY